MAMSNALSVRGLEKRFRNTVAVRDLDLDVHGGELFGLVGPDGAGKTTMLRLLATIMVPGKGSGTVAGFDLLSQAESVKRRIGYVPQRFSLYPELSVRENLDFFADIFKVFDRERDDRFRQVLEFSRLGPFQDRLARDLSGGMRQKLALACALIHTPRILLLDEPTTGVDPISRRELWKLLLQLWRQGTTIIVTTPYMDEAERCERIGFMQGGRLLEVASPTEFKARYPFEVIELACEDRHRARAEVLPQAGILGVDIFGDKIHVKVDSAAEWIPRIRELLRSRGIELQSVRKVPPSVEDVFLRLARRGSGPPDRTPRP